MQTFIINRIKGVVLAPVPSLLIFKLFERMDGCLYYDVLFHNNFHNNFLNLYTIFLEQLI